MRVPQRNDVSVFLKENQKAVKPAPIIKPTTVSNTNTNVTNNVFNTNSTTSVSNSNYNDNFEKLKNNKEKYVLLKEQVSTITKSISSTIENLEIPSDKIEESYNIDLTGIDNKKIYSIRQALINQKKYLEEQVIPEINRKIQEIGESMVNL